MTKDRSSWRPKHPRKGKVEHQWNAYERAWRKAYRKQERAIAKRYGEEAARGMVRRKFWFVT